MTLSLAAVLAEAARRHPDRVAVVDGGTRITYGRLWAEALAQAGALRGLGVGPGDRVALMMPNCAGFPGVTTPSWPPERSSYRSICS